MKGLNVHIKCKEMFEKIWGNGIKDSRERLLI